MDHTTLIALLDAATDMHDEATTAWREWMNRDPEGFDAVDDVPMDEHVDLAENHAVGAAILITKVFPHLSLEDVAMMIRERLRSREERANGDAVDQT